jgi:hypothetical protein
MIAAVWPAGLGNVKQTWAAQGGWEPTCFVTFAANPLMFLT